jgi:hypothetical protein
MYWTVIQPVTTPYRSVTHRLVFSVTVIVALLDTGFQRCNVLGFRVQWLLSSLAEQFCPSIAQLSARIAQTTPLGSYFTASKDLRIIVEAPRYVPNPVIHFGSPNSNS